MPRRSSGGKWSRSLFTYTRSGIEHCSATSSFQAASDDAKDFLAFLSVAQSLNVDFLPLTWPPALDAIGEGATAKIRQATISVGASLAFKCPKGWSDVEDGDNYRALIAEISVLRCPPVRNHPNIARLEGIWWDIDVENSKARPVLVTEKAPHGDLFRFMTLGEGSKLSLKSRLGLCHDVALAIRAMHQNHIIHGDIKPANILVFPTTSSDFTAKVTDFGYSSLYAGEDDFVYMPKSGIWTAPEWHHRGFRIADAIKMDLYSFGMICAWILRVTDSPNFLGQLGSSEELISQFLLQCLAFVKAAKHLCHRDRSSIQALFKLTLSFSPAGRATNMDELIDKLPCHRSKRTIQHMIPLVDTTEDYKPFGITTCIARFMQAHYVLRKYYAACLHKKVSTSSKAYHEALELAICYHLGFGVDRDTRRVSELLAEYDIPVTSLENIIASLASQEEPGYHNDVYQNYKDQGFVREEYHTEKCRTHEDLKLMEAHYLKEIADMELSLGRQHYLLQFPRVQLSHVLQRDGRWDELEQLQVEMLHFALQIADTQQHADFIIDITSYKSMLAQTYIEQARPEEAEKLELEVAEYREAIYGLEHPDTLDSLADLARIYTYQTHHLKAAELERRVLESRRRIFGMEHPETILAAERLASSYVELGRWAEAESLLLQVLSFSRRVLGPEDSVSVNGMEDLTRLYMFQKEWDKAERIQMQILDVQEVTLRPNHPDILDSKDSLAAIYAAQDQWEKAENLQLEILEAREMTLGSDHLDTMNSLSALGTLYRDKGQLTEAESTQRKLIRTQLRALGSEHVNTLLEMRYLAETLSMSGQKDEAEQLCCRAANGLEAKLGSENPHTLEAKLDLARAYAYKEEFKAAQDIALGVLSIQKKAAGLSGSNLLYCTSNLAYIYGLSQLARCEWNLSWETDSDLYGEHVTREEMEDLLSTILQLAKSEAECLDMLEPVEELTSRFQRADSWDVYQRLETKIVEKRKEVQGPDDPATWTSMEKLANSFHRQGKFEESERLEKEVLLAWQRLRGPEHPQTIKAMMNLAHSCGRQEKYREAVELATHVAEFRSRNPEAQDPDTRDTEVCLEQWKQFL